MNTNCDTCNGQTSCNVSNTAEVHAASGCHPGMTAVCFEKKSQVAPKFKVRNLHLPRGHYGEIGGGTDELRRLVRAAREILDAAVKADKLDAEYCDVDRKHRGSALNYDLYDVVVTRGRVVSALFQARQTTCTKYGNSPVKDYVLLTRRGRAKVPAVEWLDDARKRRVVRLSRHSLLAGEVIEVLTRHGSQSCMNNGGEQ